jgi:hypothetical protein
MSFHQGFTSFVHIVIVQAFEVMLGANTAVSIQYNILENHLPSCLSVSSLKSDEPRGSNLLENCK